MEELSAPKEGIRLSRRWGGVVGGGGGAEGERQRELLNLIPSPAASWRGGNQGEVLSH